MSKMGRVVPILFVCLFSIVPARAQEPTLHETMEWIKGKLIGTQSGGECQSSEATYFKVTDATAEGSTLTFTQVEQLGGFAGHPPNDSVRRITTLSFADIDPLSIKIIGVDSGMCRLPVEYYVMIETTSGKRSIRSQEQQNNSGKITEKNDQVSKIIIPAGGDKDFATRLETAIKHAVKMSGGKVDPF